MPQPIHDPSDSTLAEKLAAYAPRPPRIDRDRLMFDAGQASAAAELSPTPGLQPLGSRWFWPTSTLAMSALSLGLTVAVLVRPDPPQRIVYVPSAAVSSQAADATTHPETKVPLVAFEGTGDGPALTLSTLPDDHPFKLRQIALTEGVDALRPADTDAVPRTTPPLSRGMLLQQLSAPPRADQPQPGLFRWPAWLTTKSTM